MPLLRGKNRLSHNLYLWLSESHFKKYCEVFGTTAFISQAAFAFLAGSSIVGLDSQRIESILQ
jgi:hypothetical protein